MSEAPRIKVEGRARPVCPYCKDEVAGGHVWLCPGCSAAHHADCHAEHSACAACGLTTAAAAPPAAAAAATTGGPALTRMRLALESLGFAVVREHDDGRVMLMHPAWSSWGTSDRLAHLVQLAQPDRLTPALGRAHLEALARDPLAQRQATLLYVVEDPGGLDAEAEAWLRSAGTALQRSGQACVPVAWRPGRSIHDSVVSPVGLLGPSFPAHDDVVRRAALALAAPAAPLERGPPPATRAAPPNQLTLTSDLAALLLVIIFVVGLAGVVVLVAVG